MISQVADGQDPEDPVSYCGQLVSDVTSFIVRIGVWLVLCNFELCLQAMLDQPLSTQQLQLTARQRMEVIVSAAANMATSEYTRDLHQGQITTECNAVRVQFHKLLQVLSLGISLVHNMYPIISCAPLDNTPQRLQWRRLI